MNGLSPLTYSVDFAPLTGIAGEGAAVPKAVIILGLGAVSGIALLRLSRLRVRAPHAAGRGW